MRNRNLTIAAGTKGTGVYTPTTPVTPTDPYFDNVSLLLTGDTTPFDTHFSSVTLLLDGSSLIDKSNNRLTFVAYGNAAVNNMFKKFGTGSYYFDGSGDRLAITDSTVMSFSGDFTIECWMYCKSYRTVQNMFYNYVFNSVDASGGNWTYPYINAAVQYNGTFGISFYGSAGTTGFGTTSAIAMNTWYHVALVRSSGTMSAYINGAVLPLTSGSQANNGTISQTGLIIGDSRWNTGSESWDGYIDEFRVTNGVARYTSTFTPPTSSFPTHQIIDSSVYQLPITLTGNVKIDTASKKVGSGAMYFNGITGGSNAYILLNNSNFALNSRSFTIEGWFNCNVPSGSYGVVFALSTGYTGSTGISLFIDSASTLYFWYNGTSLNASSTISFNTWYHFAYVKNGSNILCFLNGILLATTSNAFAQTSNNLTIGSTLGGTTWDATYTAPIYIDDFRITRDVARYTANFTPPTASLPTIPPTIPADPWWGNVSLLLNGDNNDIYGSGVSFLLTGQNFTDVTGNVAALTVTNAVTNSSVKKYTNNSYYFNENSKAATSGNVTATGYGNNDFTIEMWVYNINTSTGNRSYYEQSSQNVASDGTRMIIGIKNTNKLRWYLSTIGDVDTTTWDSLPIGSWFHLAIARSSGLMTAYVNGTAIGSTATIATFGTSGTISIGRNYDNAEPMYGYLADIRITKNVNRYANNTVAPASDLVMSRVTDLSANNATITAVSDAWAVTNLSRYGSTSLFFKGAGDYISIADTATLNMGTNDFTWECWIYPTSPSNYQCIMTKGNSYTGSTIGLWLAPATGGFNLQVSTIGTGTTLITINKWYHVAFSKSSSIIKAWLNGIQQFSVADTVDYTTTSFPFTIGDRSASHPYLNYPFTGYIDDLRITKGYARYTQNFTPPSQSFATQYISTGYDPNYADVSLLLNGNGTNGSTSFTDLSPLSLAITTNGVVNVDTSIKKYGTGSMYFNGASGSALSIAVPSYISIGTGDFTIEAWAYFLNITGWRDIICCSTLGTASFGITTNNGNLGAYNLGINASGTIVPTNTWCHVAVSRMKSTVSLFLNGNLITTASNIQDFIINQINVGSWNNIAGENLNGYIDDLRLTKGYARYTANFTPPTYQLPTDTTGTVTDQAKAYTSLLLRGNGTNGSTTFIDESLNNSTVTNSGSVVVTTNTKKFGTGSIYFNGSSYLSVVSNAVFELGTGDYTIECWVYPTSIRNGENLMYVTDVTGGTSFGYNQTQVYIGARAVAYDATVTYTVETYAWTHLAACRVNGTVKFYANGSMIGIGAVARSCPQGPAGVGDYPSLPGNGVTGLIDDLRVTKGYARYPGSFTPPTYEAPIGTSTLYDYNYNQVVLLINGEGINGSTTFIDSSSMPKTIVASGNAVISTAIKKFGTGSISLDSSGPGAYLTVTNGIPGGLPGDFTVECWIYYSSSTDWSPIVETRTADDTVSGIYFTINSSRQLGFYPHGFSTTTVPANQWVHIAAARQASTLKLYINGVLALAATVNPATYTYPGSTVIINNWFGGSGRAISGYLDDLRITKGVARYTENFTPPAAPLPTSGGY